jgi:hypothetical protein
MKVFISVGMHNRPEEDVRKDIERATLDIIKRFGDDVEIVHNYDCPRPVIPSRLHYLGEAIKALGKCDACYFVKGWINHKGCVIEKTVCDLYKIHAFLESIEDIVG